MERAATAYQENTIARENLRRTAVAARLQYFGLGLTERQTFDNYEELQPALLRKITQVLNSTIQAGGRIVIIDFPFAAHDYRSRAQVVSQSSYLRQVFTGLQHTREFRRGHFSVSFAKPKNRNVPGALSLEVKDKFGTEHVYTTTWNEEEAPEKRFAVLTVGSEGWKQLLDFKMPEPYFIGKPRWKINTDLFA